MYLPVKSGCLPASISPCIASRVLPDASNACIFSIALSFLLLILKFSPIATDCDALANALARPSDADPVLTYPAFAAP